MRLPDLARRAGPNRASGSGDAGDERHSSLSGSEAMEIDGYYHSYIILKLTATRLHDSSARLICTALHYLLRSFSLLLRSAVLFFWLQIGLSLRRYFELWPAHQRRPRLVAPHRHQAPFADAVVFRNEPHFHIEFRIHVVHITFVEVLGYKPIVWVGVRLAQLGGGLLAGRGDERGQC